MKIGRRSFLSFLIGGAAGTALSPLPWKLTDDLSIWSQMWPWTPVPPRGEAATVNSVCTLCPGGCGISVKKIDQRAIKIEGMEGHPVNDGGICLLGLSGLQLLYGHNRVKGPMMKVDGRWQKITWETAVEQLAERLSGLRSKGEPHRLACISGFERGTVAELFNRFLSVYGSPNFITLPSVRDSYEAALYLMQGARGVAGFDFDGTDFLLSFGSGLLEGWGSPVRMFRAKSRWRETGGKVVQLEPRLSSTAAKSDAWIPIQPGTEGVMALGLAHVLLRDRLYRRDFVERQSAGFVQWSRHVLDEYPPERVAGVTGVDAARIVSLAAEFAAARHPLAICGRGRDSVPVPLGEAAAVHALNALVGAVNREGGVFAIPEPDYVRWPEAEMDRIVSEGL